DTLRAQLRGRPPRELPEARAKPRTIAGLCEEGPRDLDARPGAGEARGREHPGAGRNDDTLHAQALREGAGMEPARAAERVERSPARILAALQGDGPERTLHRRLDDLQDPFRAGLLAHAQLPREGSHGGARERAIERERASEEVSLAEPAENQVCVGDRGRRPAPIAGWAGIRPRPLRPHPESRR